MKLPTAMRNARPSKKREVRPAEGYRSGSTDDPTRCGCQANGPGADPGPLEEAVGEREDRSAHETLSGMAK